jgi:hypothetical protein
MCLLKKVFLFIFFFFLLLFCLADALRAEEPDRWYLISETELRSIETLLEKSETDRRNWELQARGLKNEAATLNGLLSAERKQHRALETSFNEYEKDQLIKLSLKNGEIADLKKEVAKEKLETEKYKGMATTRLVIIIAWAVITVLFIAFKVCRFFRLI